MFSCTLKPMWRLDTNNPYPIPSHWVFPNKWYPIIDQTSLSKTLSQTKLLENHTLHSSTYPYSLNDGNPLPPTPGYCTQLRGVALIAGRCPSDFRQVAVTKFVFCRHKRVTMTQKYVVDWRHVPDTNNDIIYTQLKSTGDICPGTCNIPSFVATLLSSSNKNYCFHVSRSSTKWRLS